MRTEEPPPVSRTPPESCADPLAVIRVDAVKELIARERLLLRPPSLDPSSPPTVLYEKGSDGLMEAVLRSLDAFGSATRSRTVRSVPIPADTTAKLAARLLRPCACGGFSTHRKRTLFGMKFYCTACRPKSAVRYVTNIEEAALRGALK